MIYRIRRARAAIAPCCILAGAACLAWPCLADEAVKYEVEYEADVTYGTAGEVPLLLDVARPKDAPGPLAGIVFIHGGGWAAGGRGDFGPFARKAAERGFLAVTIDYRLAPEHRFPAQVEDCKCAVRWLRAHAEELHLDPERIGALGGSAGAHLAMMLGTLDPTDGLEGDGGWPDRSSQVQAVVSFVGPTHLVGEFPDVSDRILEGFLGGTQEEKLEDYQRASPIKYVDGDDPPMLLFQGTQDVLVPYDQAFQMATALDQAGVPGRVEMLIGAGHGWGEPELSRTLAASFDFFDQHLKPAAAGPP